MKHNFLQSILALPFSLRQQRLMKQRPAIGELEFVRKIQEQGGDEDAAILIRNYLVNWIYVVGFTPYPEDKFSYVFGIAEEELDEDLILMVFRCLDVKPPDVDQIIRYGVIDTSIQVAQLIHRVRNE